MYSEKKDLNKDSIDPWLPVSQRGLEAEQECSSLKSAANALMFGYIPLVMCDTHKFRHGSIVTWDIHNNWSFLLMQQYHFIFCFNV